MFEAGKTWIMGVVNVTPDSFSDGGQLADSAAAVDHAMGLVAAGADVVDVGGESTRPGSRGVSAQEELDRVIPVIEGIADRSDVVISVDTSKASVARMAAIVGARFINDVSGLGDEGMAAVAAQTGAWVCLMHMQGTPGTMQEAPAYEDVVAEVGDWLASRVDLAVGAGIIRERILVDPGIGFGKALAHNLALIRSCGAIGQRAGCPVLVGVSRKSFLRALTQRPVEERAFGTAAAVTATVLAGARVVRVHDVARMRDVVLVADALKEAREA